jgi:pimeloyl-ACP methyl ester carboxylesterase
LGLRYDELFNTTGAQLLELCKVRAPCAAALGGDPLAFLDRLFEKLDAAHCAEAQLDRAGLRHLLGTLLMYVGLRDYIPALISRLDRCEPADVDALRSLEAFLAEAFGSGDAWGSLVLGTHIKLSEFLAPDITVEAATAHVGSLYFSLDVGPPLVSLRNAWATYPVAPPPAVARTKVPILVLAGQWDPQTPPSLSEPLERQWRGQHQHRVLVPWAAHSVLTQSPLDDVFDPRTCGALLVGQFLSAPTSELDTSCTARVAGINFDGPAPSLTRALFGQESAWENTAQGR